MFKSTISHQKRKITYSSIKLFKVFIKTLGLIIIRPQVGDGELQRETVHQQVVDELAMISWGYINQTTSELFQRLLCFRLLLFILL